MRRTYTLLGIILVLWTALPNVDPDGPTFSPARAADAVAAESSLHRGTVVKRLKDHKKINTDSCGLLREVLAVEDNLPLTLVIADDIKPTKGHYHLNFKEIYFVLDGWLNLKFHDPATGQYWEESVAANEVCIIDKSIHHVVTGASVKNRLCVIAVPGYSDETMSDKL